MRVFNIDNKKISTTGVIMALMVGALNQLAVAGNDCEALSAIEMAAPVPSLKCYTADQDLYKESVPNAVFKAQEIRSDVDNKIAAVKSGLTEEHLQESYLEYVSEDSRVTGRANLRNKNTRIVNYSLDPATSKAEQSIGAVR